MLTCCKCLRGRWPRSRSTARRCADDQGQSEREGHLGGLRTPGPCANAPSLCRDLPTSHVPVLPCRLCAQISRTIDALHDLLAERITPRARSASSRPLCASRAASHSPLDCLHAQVCHEVARWLTSQKGVKYSISARYARWRARTAHARAPLPALTLRVPSPRSRWSAEGNMRFGTRAWDRRATRLDAADRCAAATRHSLPARPIPRARAPPQARPVPAPAAHLPPDPFERTPTRRQAQLTLAS